MGEELTALSMCGLPGYTPYELIEVFFESGFVSINNHETLDIPRALTNVEIASLLIGLELMKDSANEANESVVANIDILISQLRSLIGDAIEVKDDPQTSFRAIIEGAISKRLDLEISYMSPVRDEISTREVTPLSLYSDSPFTYLSAYCHTAQGFRNFRVDRISGARQTQATSLSAEKAPLDASERVEVEISILQNRRSISELLQLEAVPSDGASKVEIYSPEWLLRAAIASSPNLLINKPEILRGQVGASARSILDLYLS
jgi:predicted DNA-binding transcriptional regulator YafY